jgi:hypothetical protein
VIDFVSKSHPTQRARSCTVAISQIINNVKMALKPTVGSIEKLLEFHYDLPQTVCSLLNFFARHNFSKPRRDFVDKL